jgi:multidrug efflux pump subunit AcrA (membrane-fusion protein)
LIIGAVVAGAVLLGVGAFTANTWRPWVFPTKPEEGKGSDAHAAGKDQVQLSQQARKNLRLVVQRVQPTTHWRTIAVPGLVAELPGRSDHAVTAPVAGVIRRVAVLPWDTVRPGDELFTLELASESLQNTQAELHKTARNLQINQEQRNRLTEASRSGAVPAATLLDLEYQQRRLLADQDAYSHLLRVRGLSEAQVEEIKKGNFVTRLTIRVPGLREEDARLVKHETPAAGTLYEVQELKVNLGEQVQAGQLLGYLTDHQALYVEGRGFKQEVPLLERAARNGWFVRAEFPQDDAEAWLGFRPELPVLALTALLQPGCVAPLLPPDGPLPIRFLANTVDPASQTYPFYLPLNNQFREYVNAGKTYRIWRYRPGQRVLLHVPVEFFTDVFVLPAEAVVHEGVEVYVFRQNGDVFERRPVRLLHADRRFAVLANDGSISPGNFIAHNAAAQLNFALKAQSGDDPHDH